MKNENLAKVAMGYILPGVFMFLPTAAAAFAVYDISRNGITSFPVLAGAVLFGILAAARLIGPALAAIDAIGDQVGRMTKSIKKAQQRVHLPLAARVQLSEA